MIRPALLFAVVGLSTCASSAQTWTWQTFVFKQDVWMRSYADKAGQFDFRIGAGGAISEMRDVTKNYRRLLSPSFSGEATDRIIQWTWWSNTIRYEATRLPDFEKRFNITQGGTFKNTISPAIAVEYTPAAGRLDVYSTPQDQWKIENASAMQSKISALTRYEMLDGGVLKVRRVMRVGAVTLLGKKTSFQNLYVEGWTPFDCSKATFDAMALGLDAKGNPTWWYKAGSNIPTYPAFDVATRTNGYAVVYNDANRTRSAAVGVVFGKGKVVAAGAGNTHVLNSMGWSNGIGVLPALSLSNVAEGSIIDWTILIVPGTALDQDLRNQIEDLVPRVPAPVVYAPATKFAGELATIVARLNSNVNVAGQRTDHLGGLFKTIPAAK